MPATSHHGIRPAVSPPGTHPARTVPRSRERNERGARTPTLRTVEGRRPHTTRARSRPAPEGGPVDDQTRSRVATELLEAYDSKEPLEPLTATHEGMTLEDAYAIQLLQIEERRAGGRTVKGHKV